MKNVYKPKEGGHAVVEVTLMAPWLFFLFVGVLDFGFYAYSAICAENAARAAALYTASSSVTADDSFGACRLALKELQGTGYVNDVTCPSSSPPLMVTAEPVTGQDGFPATRVSVTYQTPLMIPIPGILMGQMSITRTAEMRVKDY